MDTSDSPAQSAPPEPILAHSAVKPQPCEACRTSHFKCNRQYPCSSCIIRGKKADCFMEPAPSSLSSSQTAYPANHSSAAEASDSSHCGRVLGELIGRSGAEEEGLFAGATSFLAQLKLDMKDFQPSQTFVAPQRQPPEYSLEHDMRLQMELPSEEIMDGLIDFYFEHCTWVFKYYDRPSFIKRWELFKIGKATDSLALSGAAIVCAIAVYYLPLGHPLANALKLHEGEPQISGEQIDGPTADHENAIKLERADHLAMQWYSAFFGPPEQQRRAHRVYTLDQVELQLARCHFLAMSKVDTEEMWTIRGSLVSLGVAMGLHRDPGENIPIAIAERRRWAWWNIVMFERWQAFMHGRPLAISPDHHDTALPKPVSENQLMKLIGEDLRSVKSTTDDAGKRTYEAHTAHFRLSEALGKIAWDALSQSLVPYSQMRVHDANLEHLLDTLHPSLSFSLPQIANCLKSTQTGLRRQGVQALVLRMALHHIRFTLHRPYASGRPKTASTKPAELSRRDGCCDEEAEEHATSLARAIASARELIELAAVGTASITRHDEHSVYTHLTWAPVQIYSAALFLIFAAAMAPPPIPPAGRHASVANKTPLQTSNTITRNARAPPPPSTQHLAIPELISPTSSMSSNSARPYAPLNSEKLVPVVCRAVAALECLVFLPTASKALEQLKRLSPLYSSDYLQSSLETRFLVKVSLFRQLGILSKSTSMRDGGTMGVLGGGVSVEQTPASTACLGETPSHYEPITPGFNDKPTPASPSDEPMGVDDLFGPSPQSSASPLTEPSLAVGEPSGFDSEHQAVQFGVSSSASDGEQLVDAEEDNGEQPPSDDQPFDTTSRNMLVQPVEASVRVNDRLPNIGHDEEARPLEDARQCSNCGVLEDQNWRTSHLDSSKTLCNRCGLYERRTGSPRPPELDLGIKNPRAPPSGTQELVWTKDFSLKVAQELLTPTPKKVYPKRRQPKSKTSVTTTGRSRKIAVASDLHGPGADEADLPLAQQQGGLSSVSQHPLVHPLDSTSSSSGHSHQQSSRHLTPLSTQTTDFGQMLAQSSDWSRQYGNWYQPMEPASAVDESPAAWSQLAGPSSVENLGTTEWQPGDNALDQLLQTQMPGFEWAQVPQTQNVQHMMTPPSFLSAAGQQSYAPYQPPQAHASEFPQTQVDLTQFNSQLPFLPPSSQGTTSHGATVGDLNEADLNVNFGFTDDEAWALLGSVGVNPDFPTAMGAQANPDWWSSSSQGGM